MHAIAHCVPKRNWWSGLRRRDRKHSWGIKSGLTDMGSLVPLKQERLYGEIQEGWLLRKLPTPVLPGSGSRVCLSPALSEHPCFNNMIETLRAGNCKLGVPNLTKFLKPINLLLACDTCPGPAPRGRRSWQRRQRGAVRQLRAHAELRDTPQLPRLSSGRLAI